jgi:hypothetical protein
MEKIFDVLRNSKDLYGSIYHIITTMAAYDLSDGNLGLYQSQDLCRIATKVLLHLPLPDEDANVW